MVSALWKACAAGDAASVNDLLTTASPADLEVQDQSGLTPLIEAVRNGHVDIVRALLEKGADPNHPSMEGRPEHYTKDPFILQLLGEAQAKAQQAAAQAYQDPMADPSNQQYYGPPPGAYYYPGYYPGPPPPMPEGGAVAYYTPPPPAPAPGDQQQYGNIPPPDVARMIPCRFFPACRYGSSCLFLHPPYPGAPPPPGAYHGHYDPMAPPPFAQPYYPGPPPSFSPPNGVPPHMSPTSPQHGPHGTPLLHHGRNGSEVMSPIQGQLSSPAGPYSAVSPMSPPFGGPVPVPSSFPPLPPPQQQAPVPSAPSPYSATSPHAPPFAMQSPPMPPMDAPNGEPNGFHPPPPNMQANGYAPHPRDGPSHARRGSMRRPSFSRKPTCIFWPSGRCRNGDECRFPHVMPEGPNAAPQPYASRGGHRPRFSSHVNGFSTIEEKMANMSMRASGPPQADGINRSFSAEVGNRGRPPPNMRPNGVAANGARLDKRTYAKQRVPGADEFPTLAGAAPSPSRSPGLNGPNGWPERTAAQVLQAPPPIRKDSYKEVPSSAASDHSASAKDSKSSDSGQPNGVVNGVTEAHTVHKLPISFAAVAAEGAKEVAVSA